MKARCFEAFFLLTLFIGWVPQALSADTALYGILKSQQFIQSNSNAPVTPTSNGFAFSAVVVATGDHLVTNATVKPSNSTPLRQLLSDASQAAWRFEERFNTQLELNNVYPSGTILSPVNYTVTIKTVHDGTKTPSLSFGAASVVGSPPTLQVTNFGAAQSINPGADFVLRWNSAGGQNTDTVQLRVLNSASNTVFASADPLTAGALNGQSNAVVIPASTLLPLTQYTGHLTITRPLGLEMNSYPGATGLPALVKDIEFPMATAIRTVPPAPRLDVVSTNSNPFRFRYTGGSNLTYQIQISDNLTAWTTVFTTNSVSGTGIYTDPSSAEAPKRFYRILLGQ